MTGGGLMRKSSWILLCLLFVSSWMNAQDQIPQMAKTESLSSTVDSLKRYGYIAEPVALTDFPLPANFRNIHENVVLDPNDILAPFWQKLAESTSLSATDSVRIVHVGDSHVRGHVFPLTAGEVLHQAFDRLSYVDDGINGATSLTFSTPERIREIVKMQPDLLIISFGTNESHGKGYNENRHYAQMTDFLLMLRSSLPDTPILLTTPPGSYERGGTRRRRTYTINPRTKLAVQNILKFADEHQLAVWNLYEIFGGAERACLNWNGAGLMRPDHIHYLPEGYALQGQWLSQAIVKAYNAYVESN